VGGAFIKLIWWWNWPLIGGQTTVEESGDRTQPTSGQGSRLVNDVVKVKASECREQTGEIGIKVTIDLASEKASSEVLKSRKDRTRYTLTNVSMVTTPQIYSALQNSLRRNLATYAAIVKVVPVRQPNRHHRFDIWITNEYAAGLQSALRLDFVGRKKLPAEIRDSNNLAIMGIQEHLRTVEQYVPGIKEYIIFEKPKEKDFRGHCLYVHQYLAAHEVYQKPERSGSKVSGPCHQLTSSTTSCEKTQVDNVSFDISDHWPVLIHTDLKNAKTSPTKKSWNRKHIVGHGRDLALSNRWDALQSDDIETEEELNKVAEEWVQTLNAIGEELHMLRIPQPAKQTYLNKATKNLVKRSRKARVLYNTALLDNDHVNLPRLRKSMQEKGRRVKVAIKKIATEEKLTCSTRINKTLVENEGADFHSAVQAAQGRSQSNQDNSPCFDVNGRLMTEPNSILQARAAYYQDLASDPTGISKDPTSKWAHIPKKNFGGPRKLLHIRQTCNFLGEEEDGEKDGSALPNILDTQAFLQAIRQIQRNLAPGKSGVLAIHIKKFLKVECQLQISKDWKDPEMDWYGENCYS
ncbi:hypothetical protein MJO29_002134, partial [Puccinia striiformis f. sp. tritici]